MHTARPWDTLVAKDKGLRHHAGQRPQPGHDLRGCGVERRASVGSFWCLRALDPSPLCDISADTREVPVGAPLTIRGNITDIATATHAVKVFWGDGGSSFLAPGCTDPGCPTPVVSDPTFHQFSLSHPYEKPGTYPIRIEVYDGKETFTYNTNAEIFGALVQGPTDVAAGDPATYTYHRRSRSVAHSRRQWQLAVWAC